jgi:phage baseplate assembly protein W
LNLTVLPLSVPCGTTHVPQQAFARVAGEIRLVLETEPGTIPWRPEFGCPLASLSGMSATPDVVAKARFHVESAFARFLPHLTILRCDVQLRRVAGSADHSFPIPAAESALLGLGTQVDILILLDVQAPEGQFSLSTPLPISTTS